MTVQKKRSQSPNRLRLTIYSFVGDPHHRTTNMGAESWGHRNLMCLILIILVVLLIPVSNGQRSRSNNQRRRTSQATTTAAPSVTIPRPDDPRLRTANVSRSALASRRSHAYVQPIDSMNDLFAVSSDIREQKLMVAASHHHHHSKHKKHHHKKEHKVSLTAMSTGAAPTCTCH